MAEHLGWGLSRKKQEIRNTVKFLESMGLKREVVEAQYKDVGGLPEPIPRGWRESLIVQSEHNLRRAISSIFSGFGYFSSSSHATYEKKTPGNTLGLGASSVPPVYSRAKFERGELAALRAAFESFASDPLPVEITTPPITLTASNTSHKFIPITQVVQVLQQVPGYQDLVAKGLEKDLEYVIEEAGYQGYKQVGFEEFVEVSISSSPFFIG